MDTTTAWPELMSSLSAPQEERAGERRTLLLNAPLPIALPTRASRGEGENFWWLCHAPLRQFKAAALVFSRTLAALRVHRAFPVNDTRPGVFKRMLHNVEPAVT